MNGPEGAAELVSTLIGTATAGAFKAKLDELVDRLELDAADLPYATLTVLTEPRPIGTLSVNEYPALIIIPQAASATRLEEPDDAGRLLYVVRYPIRLFIFARGTNFAETDLRRKRYTLAAREVLFQHARVLGLDTSSYRESYSDVAEAPAKEVRTVAGAFIEWEMDVEELLDVPPELTSYPAPAGDGWATSVVEALLDHPEADL